MDFITVVVIVGIIIFWSSFKLIRNHINKRITHFCQLDAAEMDKELQALQAAEQQLAAKP